MHLQFLKTLPSNFDGVSTIFSSKSQIVYKTVSFTRYVPQKRSSGQVEWNFNKPAETFLPEGRKFSITVRQKKGFHKFLGEIFVSKTFFLTHRVQVWQLCRKRTAGSPKTLHWESEINSEKKCLMEKTFHRENGPLDTWTEIITALPKIFC